MSEDIRWMQLSDLHIGSPDYRWTDNTLKERLRYLLEEGRIPSLHFIIITGDIIHRGKMKNKNYVDELHKFLDILSLFADKIIVTPGNHDYQRNNPRFSLLADWELETDKRNVEDDYASKLTVDFEECEKMFQGYDNVLFNAHSQVIKLDDINIVSLNTSVFSGQPQKGDRKKVYDNGRLWICERDLPAFSSLNTENPTIMIGHHPFEMFSSECIERLKMFSKSCGIKHYFCGHMHKAETVNQSVTQHTSAGLFRDKYNIPSFAIYSFKKSANETLNKEYYEWDGDWSQTQEKANTVIETNKDKESGTQTTEESFMIAPSDISDGAIRMPYGDGKFNIYVSKDEPSTITLPHKHEDVDEITYVTQGRLIIVIDEDISIVSEGSALLMPKGKFHGLIPA